MSIVPHESELTRVDPLFISQRKIRITLFIVFSNLEHETQYQENIFPTSASSEVTEAPIRILPNESVACLSTPTENCPPAGQLYIGANTYLSIYDNLNCSLYFVM
ncbi:hypothetical protein [Burkholderia plantarii]|uniref:hypothetical protein n=1 Tax=Burkholderia plantarii TaxID=41899 RepID=UPI00114CC0FD|nr:hypothetical protein [Burkholderia plantarii]